PGCDFTRMEWSERFFPSEELPFRWQGSASRPRPTRTQRLSGRQPMSGEVRRIVCTFTRMTISQISTQAMDTEPNEPSVSSPDGYPLAKLRQYRFWNAG